LMNRRERRIGHSFYFEAPFVAVVAAGSDELFSQIVWFLCI
jgi:hypothetical protein